MALFNNTPMQPTVADLQELISSRIESVQSGKGIAAKPEKVSASKEDLVLGYFREVFNTTQEKADSVRGELAPTMEALARESALLNAQEREAAGITQSLVEGGGEAYRKKPPEGTITRPVARPDELVTDTAKDVEESAPVTVETEDTGLDDDAMGLPSDAGLMTRPKARPETAVETATSSYSATTDAVYTDFYDNNEEGDAAHVGLDSQNLTLPAGIVADGGVTYDGKEVKAGKNTVKASAFDASKVDMSKAYKKVGGKTYKRADYDSDESWSKAVIEAFKDVVKSGAGDSWDNLDDGTKQAITKLAWNNGEGWASYNTSKALSKELAKETKDKAIVAAGILNYSTVAGGGASIGVSKARANAWNKMADEHGFAEITKIEADNTGSKTKFNYYDVDGNLVHTETTSRSPTIYANGSLEKVEKDSEGNW